MEATKLATLLIHHQFVPKMRRVIEDSIEISHNELVQHIKDGVNVEKILKNVPSAKEAQINAIVVSGTVNHEHFPPEATEGTLKDNVIFVYVDVTLNNNRGVIA